ncbi:MAG: tetratricopeptide repeat protein [Armatimonadota bacterium]
MEAEVPAVEGYAVQRLLGRGRHGPTWLAEASDGGLVALREIECYSALAAQRIHDDPELRRVATVMAGMTHSSLARNLEVLAVGTRVYVAEQFVELPTLAQIIAQDGPLPVHEAWALVCQVLSALEFGHLRGLLHLDVRPTNVHIDRPQRHAVLTDFGHMRLLLGLRPDLTLTDLADEHHAPEVHLGGEPTPAAEVFSVGTLLHVLITDCLLDRPDLRRLEAGGRFAFLELERQEARDPEEMLAKVGEQWPSVVSVLRRALESDAGRRYQRAGRMQNALAAAYRADAFGGEYVERDAPGGEGLASARAQRDRAAEEERRPVRVEGGVEFCDHCGRPLPPGRRICARCGTPRARRAPAISLPPQRREPTGYFQRQGDRLLGEGRYQEAADAYRMAARRAPGDVTAQHDLADLALLTGNHAEAERAYRAVLRVDPEDLAARHELARALMGGGRHREAVYELRKVLAADPPDALRLSALTQLGAAYAGLGRHGEARQAWEQVLAEEPGNAHVHFCVGLSWLAQRDDARAVRSLRQALRADPNYQEAREMLRRVNERLRRRAEGGYGRDGYPHDFPLPPMFELLRLAFEGGRALLARHEADRLSDSLGPPPGTTPGRSIPIEEGDAEEERDE